MKLNALLAGAAIALATSFAAASANAQIINGSFETGDLTGWTSNGYTAVTGVNNGYTPTNGQFLASTFAGPCADCYATLSQTFTTTGGLFQGDAAFLAQDYMPYNDDAFVQITSIATNTVLFTSSVGSVGDYGATPWTHFSTTLGAGEYTVTAGVRNNLDNMAGSQLLVDNFSVSAGVPEPASWALMLTGFLGAGSVLRTNRRRTAVAATA